MAILIFLGAMLALWAFIVWDRRRLSASKLEPVSREAFVNGWTPRTNSNFLGWLGVSAAAGIMAVANYLNPSLPPFSGRLALFYDAAYSALGMRGPAVFWGCVALLFAVVGLSVRRSS